MDVVKKIEAQNSTPPKKACVIEVPEMVRGKGWNHNMCLNTIWGHAMVASCCINIISIISIISYQLSALSVLSALSCSDDRQMSQVLLEIRVPSPAQNEGTVLFNPLPLPMFSQGLRWTASGVSRFLRLAEEQNSPVGWLMGLEPPNRSCEDKIQGIPICCYCTIYNEYIRSLSWWISINVQALKFRLWMNRYSLFVTEWVVFFMRRYADVAYLMTCTEVDRCTMLCLLVLF